MINEFEFTLNGIADGVRYKYECGENQLHPALIGVSSNLIVFPWSSSAGRMYMASNMIPKSVVTDGRDGRWLLTGFERKYAKTTRKVMATSNMIVEEDIFCVPSHDPEKMTDDWNPMYVIFKNDEKNAYDLLTLPAYNTQNTSVGFEFKYNKDNLRKLKKGAFIPKGTIFADSPRVNADGEWCFAMPTRVAAFSDFRTEEDGIIITQSYAERLACMFRHQRDFAWNEDDWVPLMLYGTDENPSPFPAPGEPIREDGIIMGFRKRIKENALVSLTRKALREPDPTYDHLLYAPRGIDCEVMSVRVESERTKNKANNRGTDYIPQRHNKMLDQYERRQNEMWLSVINWFETKKRLSRNNKISVTHELGTFIRNAYGNWTRDKLGRTNPLTRSIKRDKYKDWNVVIELKQRVTGRVKWKLSGLNGDKGVIVLIIPDHEAPRYADGTSAEVILNNIPAFRRQIFSLLLELSINFITMNIHREVKEMRKANNYAAAYQILMDYFAQGFPEFVEKFRLATETEEDRVEYIDNVCKKNIAIHVVSNTKLFGVNLINKLREKYKYAPQKAMFVNELGELQETANPILISVQDMILLDKFGSDMSAQCMPKSNLFGMPAKMSDSDRYTSPMTDKNNKNQGETEGRWKASQMGGQETVKHLSLAYSPDNRKMAVRRMVRATDAMNINQLIKPDEYINNRALDMSKSMLLDSGYGVRDELPSDRVEYLHEEGYNESRMSEGLLRELGVYNGLPGPAPEPEVVDDPNDLIPASRMKEPSAGGGLIAARAPDQVNAIFDNNQVRGEV